MSDIVQFEASRRYKSEEFHPFLKPGVQILVGERTIGSRSREIITVVPEFRDDTSFPGCDHTLPYELYEVTHAFDVDLSRRIFPTPNTSVQVATIKRVQWSTPSIEYHRMPGDELLLYLVNGGMHDERNCIYVFPILPLIGIDMELLELSCDVSTQRESTRPYWVGECVPRD